MVVDGCRESSPNREARYVCLGKDDQVCSIRCCFANEGDGLLDRGRRVEENGSDVAGYIVVREASYRLNGLA